MSGALNQAFGAGQTPEQDARGVSEAATRGVNSPEAQAISTGAASVATGVGAISVGIAAAAASFEEAGLAAGNSVVAAGIGGLGMVPPPGQFISEMKNKGGQLGEIQKEMQNQALNMQKQISQLQKGVEGALDSVVKAAGNIAKKEVQTQTDQLNRLNDQLINFSKQTDQLAAEFMKQLKV